ncbi:hypothetical protein CRG98_027683 [Punica granatum]|uniref:Uncharacterized protein n=1 Tax=Punica granatum TaxID=22663 RepID=A0A2I0J6S0_PUNGR|nr:hypothetical protein CRG98_027683 [Punica granatum]
MCASEFHLVGARVREAYATRLGSAHLPGNARRTHVRRSYHLLFTTRRSRAVESPGSRGTRKIETLKMNGTGRANETHPRTGCPFSPMDRGVSNFLTSRMWMNHGMTVMPLDNKTCDVRVQIEDRVTRRNLGGIRASRLGPPQIGPGLKS